MSVLPAVTGCLLTLTGAAHAAVVISEINYAPTTDGQDTEFVEILNTGPTPVDISGWHWNGITYEFPPETTLEAAQFFVLAVELVDGGDANIESFEHFFGNGDNVVDEFPYPVDDYSNGLVDGGELVELLDSGGTVVDGFDYTGDTGAAKTGFSLERHSLAPGDFVAGTIAHGTPGCSEVALVAVPEPTALALVFSILPLVGWWRRAGAR